MKLKSSNHGEARSHGYSWALERILPSFVPLFASVEVRLRVCDRWSKTGVKRVKRVYAWLVDNGPFAVGVCFCTLSVPSSLQHLTSSE